MKKPCLTPNTASILAVSLRALGASFCLSLILPLATAQTTPAASTSSEEPVQLPSFVVSATQDRGYLAANSISGTRVNTPIKDLPFSMSAFTSEFMQDTGARSINDVAQYAAGVKVAGTEFLDGDTSIDVRGFRQFPMQDGVYGSAHANAYVDVVATERVEVVKGPASLLYGQILPGGTVNYITKRANSTPATTVSIAGGSDDFARATLDTNQPLIQDKLLFRFNAAWENDFQVANPGRTRLTVLDPTATWNITKNLSLRVNYQWYNKREQPQATYLPASEICTPESVVRAFDATKGYPNLSDPLGGNIGLSLSPYGSADADPDKNGLTYGDNSDPGTAQALFLYPKDFNYASAHDSRITTLGTLNTELNATIGEHWVAQANFNYNSNAIRMVQTGYGGLFTPPADSLVYSASSGTWSVAPAWAAMTDQQRLVAYANWVTILNRDPHAALAHEMQNGTPTPLVWARRPRMTETWGHTDTFQLQMAGSYQFPWGTIKPLVGIYENQSFNSYQQDQNFGNASNPWFHPWDINPASPTYYINHDTYESSSLMPRRTAYNLTYVGDQAVYGIVSGSFLHDRLFVVAGARYNVSVSNNTDYLATNAADAYGTGYRAHYTTPQVGIGYKIAKDVLLYADYSTSYTLPTVVSLRKLGYDSSGNI